MRRNYLALLILIITTAITLFSPKKVLARECLFSFDSSALDYQVTNGSKVNLITFPASQFDNREGPFPQIGYSATANNQGSLIARINITVRDCIEGVDYNFYVRYWDGQAWKEQEHTKYISSGVGWWQDAKSHTFTARSGITKYQVEIDVCAKNRSVEGIVAGCLGSHGWEVIYFYTQSDNPAASFDKDCINKTCGSGDVVTFADGTISVSTTVKNTGNIPQGWWYLGIEGWRVGDYNDPWGSRSEPFWAYYNGKDGTGGGSNSPPITCTTDNQAAINLGETRVVTCNFPANLWKPTTGNQRIMFWTHERDLGVDRNGICEISSAINVCSSARNCSSNTGCWGGAWWFDALVRLEPSQVKVNISSTTTPAISTSGSTPTSGGTGVCSTSDEGTARASGLVSTPNLTGNFSTTLKACIINEERAAFISYKIPTFDDLKSRYFTQAKAGSSVDKQEFKGDKSEKDIPLTTGKDHLYLIKKSSPGSGDGNLTMTDNIPGGQTGVIFVEGNLNIGPLPNGKLTTAANSGLVFIVSGDVNIDLSVTQIDGVIISSGYIYTAGAGCNTSASDPTKTSPLTINGSLISLNESKRPRFCRKLTDNSDPTEKINQQAKYLVILKDLFSDTLQKWSEIP